MLEVAFSKGKIWVCRWCQNWKHISVYVEHSQVRLYVGERERLSTSRLGAEPAPRICAHHFSARSSWPCDGHASPSLQGSGLGQLHVSAGGPAFRDGVGVLFFHLGVAPFARCVANPGWCLLSAQYVSLTALSSSWAKSPLILRVTLWHRSCHFLCLMSGERGCLRQVSSPNCSAGKWQGRQSSACLLTGEPCCCSWC